MLLPLPASLTTQRNNPNKTGKSVTTSFSGRSFASAVYRCPLTDDWVALVKQVKEANDIVDVVGAAVALRPAGPTFKGLCPFHDDHRPSFDVDPRRQRYRCWACGKHGDVFSFVMEQDRVEFREAVELLARRAGISLEKTAASPQKRSRAAMLEVVRWAAEQYHQCLLDSPLAEAARQYLGERRLTGETVRRFCLGYAPLAGDWLVSRAAQAGLSSDTLEKVGLFGRRDEDRGHYDRFRDRVMFPIRDAAGRPVGFGGRIMPSSPLSARAPKYYNSSDTPLFSKRENLYGLDQARQAAATAGYLAVVEGYTDVLMAHQVGIPQVVSTMGTALNSRHVQHLRKWVPRVILVFDADAGGATGVDRALEIFVSQEVDLGIATLPEGMDPCDVLLQGPEPFRQALDNAVDALDFKLSRVLSSEAASGLEGRRRAMEAVLGIISLAPEMGGPAAVKQELVISRIAQRLALMEKTVRERLQDIRNRRRQVSPAQRDNAAQPQRAAPADKLEQELLQVLLSDPKLVPAAAAEVSADEIGHPGLRELLTGLYDLHSRGEPPDLDRLRPVIANPALAQKALEFQEIALRNTDRPAWLQKLFVQFRQRRGKPQQEELQNQLQAASDHTEAVELLRQLQLRTVSSAPDVSPLGGPRRLSEEGFDGFENR
jgi:DNA primase